MDTDPFSPLRFTGTTLELLDQTLLPRQETWVSCSRPEQVADAIRRLALRGAPQIGVAAAYGLALAFSPAADLPADLDAHFERTAGFLGATRPTAVNLRWALERGRQVFAGRPDRDDPRAAHEALCAWARELHEADLDANRRMAAHGAQLFPQGARVLTHCNTGALATAGVGTALGVIAEAFRQGKVAEVFADETRPLLQGARLTAWEAGLGIPHRLVADAAAATVLARGMADLVIVGADRIAGNGDTANKIGTYPLAVLAARHGVPFYVAAPRSTVDLATPSGAAIPIEERAAEELTQLFGQAVAPPGARAFNPAFDVTPAELIAAIITEEGVARPPYGTSLGVAA